MHNTFAHPTTLTTLIITYKIQMTRILINTNKKGMEKSKQNWIFLAFALAFLILFILETKKPKQEPEPLPPMLHIDYSQYSCPPVLTEEQCKKRINMYIVNNFDVEEYLLAVYNRLK